MNTETLSVLRQGDFYYPIYFKEDFSELSRCFKEEGLLDRQICIVTDSKVAPLYLEAVKNELSKVSERIYEFVFPNGEENKNLNTVGRLYEKLILSGMDRKGMLVALGGGVVGDLTGFAAATYLRGIDFVQIPTTLLSQVDSSVGGKTGVDFMKYKNMVGAFWQPRLVYMNLSTIKSLPAQEFSCGMGEIIKTGLICDRDFFEYLRNNEAQIKSLDPSALYTMVRRCCEIKAGVVERDPKEAGERALLNLGHTIGHAIEKLKNFELLHGQCVGLGLIACAEISKNRGLMTEEEAKSVKKCCLSYGLPEKTDGLSPEEILAASKKDKKMENGHVKFILMKGLGGSFIDKSVSDEELLKGIRKVI